MQRLTTSSLIVLALAATMQISPALAEDWPQFRGPNCTGISRSKDPLPVKFSAEQNVKWSVDLGDGIGCPVVAAGRVFNSAMVDDKTVGLFAHDAKTGKELWKRTWPAGDIPSIHKTNSHAATTAAADSERSASSWRRVSRSGTRHASVVPLSPPPVARLAAASASARAWALASSTRRPSASAIAAAAVSSDWLSFTRIRSRSVACAAASSSSRLERALARA